MKQLRKAGHHLNEMIMPNLSLFIAWGILSLATKGVSGDLHTTLEEVCHWMIQLLLPILISYSGGKSVGGQKGSRRCNCFFRVDRSFQCSTNRRSDDYRAACRHRI